MWLKELIVVRCKHCINIIWTFCVCLTKHCSTDNQEFPNSFGTLHSLLSCFVFVLPQIIPSPALTKASFALFKFINFMCYKTFIIIHNYSLFLHCIKHCERIIKSHHDFHLIVLNFKVMTKHSIHTISSSFY